MAYSLGPRNASPTDGSACLICRKSGTPLSRPRKGDPAPGADRADTDDLAGQVDELVAVERRWRSPARVPRYSSSASVRGPTISARARGREGFGRHQQRRVVAEPERAVDLVRRLGQRRQVVLGLRLRHPRWKFSERPWAGHGPPPLDQGGRRRGGVPEGEVPHGRRIRATAARYRAGPGPPASAQRRRNPSSDRRSRDWRPAVSRPIRTAGNGLVEVVDVEDHVALGRGETPEVERWASPHSWTAKPGVSYGPGRRPSPRPPPGRT